MATLVSFHAHPDDESIGTGGTIAKAVEHGHRAVLVFATRGELGEPVPGVLAEGEQLWQRRVVECQRSAEVLGAERVAFLGYEDSGMMGEPTNERAESFWQADVDEAAERLAAILRDVGADVLTVYDDHGLYGHPDHIQVHRVGVRAAELAGTARVFENTMNRDELVRRMDAAGVPEGMSEEEVAEQRAEMERGFGSAEGDVTHSIDVMDQLDRKRASMRAHASQISEESWFLTLPAETFAATFGTEWYIERGRPRRAGEPFRNDLFGER